eukprot:TRINITY_DN26520_c0_g1_i2.p1 TRINITY_DN26520_c0_g1~~TRINITY_DN26520_c0_g1_i2.p1  ORF type:complete len:465 (+),score=96.42 TRINITY_DN26520_c0_g1_i2:127-1521(+)
MATRGDRLWAKVLQRAAAGGTGQKRDRAAAAAGAGAAAGAAAAAEPDEALPPRKVARKKGKPRPLAASDARTPTGTPPSAPAAQAPAPAARGTPPTGPAQRVRTPPTAPAQAPTPPTLPRNSPRIIPAPAPPKPRSSPPPAAPTPAQTQPRCELSIALPSSILDNQKTWELRTHLVGQIARAAAVLRVRELVIFRDTHDDHDEPAASELFGSAADWSSYTAFVARLLMYAECPQYLRRQLMPIHRDTRHAGLLPPLALPSHPTRDEQPRFREGVVLEGGPGPSPTGKPVRQVDAGLAGKPVRVQCDAAPGTRVTLDVPAPAYSAPRPKAVIAKPADLAASGEYWGYTVRTASSLSTAVHRPDGGRYDVILGTSERGVDCTAPGFELPGVRGQKKPPRVLVVFGGPQGLESAIAADTALQGLSPDKPGEIFDCWVNVLPDQGSRTIRTEEALFIALSVLRGKVRW